MADIFQEVDDEVRQDKAHRLWSKYGGYAVGVCVAVVIATGGRAVWKEYQASQRIAESTRYAQALELLELGNHKAAADSMAALGDEASTGYSVLALLRQAQALIAAGDKMAAVVIYDGLAKSGNGGPAISGLARISAVMQMFDEASASEIDARLAPLLAGKSAWRYSALELQATLAYRDGKIEAARKQYAGLSNMAGVPQGVRQRSRQMLLILGGEKMTAKSKQSTPAKAKSN